MKNNTKITTATTFFFLMSFIFCNTQIHTVWDLSNIVQSAQGETVIGCIVANVISGYVCANADQWFERYRAWERDNACMYGIRCATQTQVIVATSLVYLLLELIQEDVTKICLPKTRVAKNYTLFFSIGFGLFQLYAACMAGSVVYRFSAEGKLSCVYACLNEADDLLLGNLYTGRCAEQIVNLLKKNESGPDKNLQQVYNNLARMSDKVGASQNILDSVNDCFHKIYSTQSTIVLHTKKIFLPCIFKKLWVSCRLLCKK